MVVYAGVEGGGTTWRVALAEGHPSNIVDSKSFVTLDDAQEQLKQIKEWLSSKKYDCLGIGTFGPIDPREVSLLRASFPRGGWPCICAPCFVFTTCSCADKFGDGLTY